MCHIDVAVTEWCSHRAGRINNKIVTDIVETPGVDPVTVCQIRVADLNQQSAGINARIDGELSGHITVQHSTGGQTT